MKKMTTKDALTELTQKDFLEEEHLSPEQLSNFTDNQLNEKEEDKVFTHLSECKRCRDVLRLANELEKEAKQIKPINNPDYKGRLKHFLPFAAAAVIFLGVPQGNKYFNPDPSFKGSFVEKNIFEESMEFWKKIYTKLFKEN